MELKEDENTRRERAQKRVEQLKGFYIHALVYVVINGVLLFNSFRRNMDNADEFWNWEDFTTLFFWGIGLSFHAAKVFGTGLIFSQNWEDRQIQKYIDEDKEDSQKYL